MAASATRDQCGPYAVGAGRLILVVPSQKLVPDRGACASACDEADAHYGPKRPSGPDPPGWPAHPAMVDDGSVDLPSTGTLTFLFTDLEDSTRLWERFPEAMKVALGRHDAILRAAIESSGGQVVKTTGDGMMAVFGGAVDATAAALAAQLGILAEAWGETGRLRVRMGIHSGQAEHRGDDYFGPAVNRAARIMAAGHGGQVLLSESASALARADLPAGADLTNLGGYRLRGLDQPEHLYQLLHPRLPSQFPPLAARSTTMDLPSRTAGIIGRRSELAGIRDRLADGSVRLLTLTGPGGTGKTTLAIREAEDLAPAFPDGVSFVDLSLARDTRAVLVAMARAIGLGEVLDRPLEDELIERLRDQRMLLVLDNLEQVTEAASTVARLLTESPRLTILATSREALRIRVEQVYPVPPLGLPPDGREVSTDAIGQFEAVQLFVDRARVVRPDFALTDDNAAAVVEICRRLDGLPLAIELAAAHLRLLSPEVLRDRLGNRLGLLRNGPRDLPERQQTLRATMDWSYGLLRPDEQLLFELLAVFAESSIVAVEAVIAELGPLDGIAVDVLDGLAGLVEKSLVRMIEAPGGEPRLAMLETVREFATDRLEARPGIAVRARRGHATYFAERAGRLQADLTGAIREAALVDLVADAADLRTAWSYWLAERDLERLDQLAGPLLMLDDAHGWYLDTVGLTQDLLTVLAALPASTQRADQEISLRTTLARALMATKGLTPEVEAAFASTVELFERGGDVHQQYSVLRGLASLYLFRAQLDRSGDLGRQILTLGERQDDAGMLIDGHLLVGTTLMTADELRAGLDEFDQAIALFPAQRHRPWTAKIRNDPRVSCLTTSGFTLWMLGYPDQAADRAEAALALAAELQHPFTTAYARFHAGMLRLWRHDSQISQDIAVGLCELAAAHEFRIWTAAGSCLLGAAQVQLGRFDEGLANIRRGMDLYTELQSPPVFWPFLLFVEATAHVQAGRPADGTRPLDAALQILGSGEGVSILPELHILKGDLLAGIADADGGGPLAAEGWYQRAFDRAGELDARTARLRAATRLARLRLADDDPVAAADTLRPIYDTFTEGFGTADLVAARQLLADLGHRV